MISRSPYQTDDNGNLVRAGFVAHAIGLWILAAGLLFGGPSQDEIQQAATVAAHQAATAAVQQLEPAIVAAAKTAGKSAGEEVGALLAAPVREYTCDITLTANVSTRVTCGQSAPIKSWQCYDIGATGATIGRGHKGLAVAEAYPIQLDTEKGAASQPWLVSATTITLRCNIGY